MSSTNQQTAAAAAAAQNKKTQQPQAEKAPVPAKANAAAAKPQAEKGGGKKAAEQQQQQKTSAPKQDAPPAAAEANNAENGGEGSATETSSPLNEFAAALKDLQNKFKALQTQYVRMEKELTKRAGKKGKGNNSKKGITPPGFKKPTLLSKELCKVLGKTEGTVLPRNEANKAIHNYLVENKLQDPNDRRKIHPNKELKSLFAPGTYDEKAAPPNHFDLQGMLKQHLTSVPEAEGKKEEGATSA